MEWMWQEILLNTFTMNGEYVSLGKRTNQLNFWQWKDSYLKSRLVPENGSINNCCEVFERSPGIAIFIPGIEGGIWSRHLNSLLELIPRLFNFHTKLAKLLLFNFSTIISERQTRCTNDSKVLDKNNTVRHRLQNSTTKIAVVDFCERLTKVSYFLL